MEWILDLLRMRKIAASIIQEHINSDPGWDSGLKVGLAVDSHGMLQGVDEVNIKEL